METQEILQGIHDWTNGKIVYDISVAHPDGQGNPTKYATLAAALGANGANIPEAMRKGGMSVKFVHSSDNKYVQYRYLLQYENTTAGNNAFLNTSNWQGIDDESIAGSENLVKSGGVAKTIIDTISQFADVDIIPMLTFVNKILDGSTGNYLLTERESYRACTNYIKVEEGVKFRTNARATGSAAGICYYNESKVFTSSIVGCSAYSEEGEVFTVPSGCSYLRFCTEKYTTVGLNFSFLGNVDNVPTESSKNFVRSGGVFSENKKLSDKDEELFDRIKRIRDGVNLNLNFDGTGYIIITSGAVGTASTRKYTTNFYKVYKDDVVELSMYATSNEAAIALYSSNNVDSFVQGWNLDITTGNKVNFVVPQDGYLRFTNNPTYNSNPYAKFLDCSWIFQEVDTKIEEVNENILIIYDNTLIPFNVSNIEQGLLSSANGQPISTTGEHPNYKYTPDYYKVIPGGILKTNFITSGSAVSAAFYDKNKQFISGAAGDITNGTVVVENAEYVRFSTQRYSTDENLWAYKDTKLPNPIIEELTTRVTELEGHIESDSVIVQPYFSIDKESWIEDETTSDFYPQSRSINSSYVGEVNPEKRYIALGFDDFRTTDFSLIIPLLNKYGARAEFNRVHSSVDINDTNKRQINNVLNSGQELGDHTWLHQKFPYMEPLFNGQDPGNPDGSQVPFPSNDQLRNDAGDGKNVFGRTLTNNVKTDLGYEAPDINTTWAAMTDVQCQQLRDYYSVMKDTATNLVVLLDILSNTYLGTTGSSRGSWDSVNGEYTGGIFTGCKTSQNHEVWERILLVTNMFLKDKFNLNYNLITWSLPGSKNSGCTFSYTDGYRYYDEAHTKKVGNMARFTSSLYKNNDGTAKERSWTDVLREFGYKTTHDAAPTDRTYCMSYQFIMNAFQSRQDALPHPTNRLLSYSKMATEYTEGTDLTGTEPYEVQMYDGGLNSDKNTFRNEIEQWRHSAANGIIWGAVIDSQDTWSERMILEGLLKYGTKTGIEFITHAEAYDICFNHSIKAGNLIYNPRLRNTAKEFMPTATTVPDNPDGYIGLCSVEMQNGIPVLKTTGITAYNHFGIPYGNIKYKVTAKGSATISFRLIKNSTQKNNYDAEPVLGTINVNNENEFSDYEFTFIVPDNGITSYEDVFGGYGDKVVGIRITYGSNLELKNIVLKCI